MGSRRRAKSRIVTSSGVALGATVLFAPVAEAATFTVTNLDDGNADGTLRDAVSDANATAGDDVVVFAAGLSGTITLDDPSGAVVVNSAGLEIQGPGAGVITVAGDGSDRLFYLHDFGAAGEDVVFSGLTLTGGNAIGDDGGAVYSLTGALYAADLTIRSSVLSDNAADASGGAVYIDGGSVAIEDSILSGNRAGGGGGALFVAYTAPSLSDEVAVAITRSQLTGNHTDSWGGAFYFEEPQGSAVISQSTLANNTADSGGGAIDVVGVYDGGDLIFDRTTISGNTSVEEGGGMNLDNVEGATVIRNSTIANNTVTGSYQGGGVYWEDAGTGDDPVIQNSTIAGNSAPGNGGAVYVETGGPIVISSSLIANNSATDGDLSESGSPNSEGFGLGHSLVEDTGGSGVITESPAGSNLLGLDPALGPLQANGGPTATMLPAFGSPALDSGIANGLTTDQRGLARTADLALIPNRLGLDGTDIGSTEIQAAECRGLGGALKIDGTPGDDTLTGTTGPDAITGLAGNDTLAASGGNDCVAGDEGRDDLKGGGGKDRVGGGAGKDRLSGGGGKDRLKGGPGKDTIKTGGGKDRVNCGGGKDKVSAGANDKVAKNCEKVT